MGEKAPSSICAFGHDISHNGHFLRRFLAIPAAIAYNTSKAESMSELHHLFWEAAMLDDDAYQHWLNQCGFSDSARTLLTDIRRSPPVRNVAGGRGNIHGRYPS